MIKAAGMVFVACLLTACADPLADVPRLADVDLADGDAAAQALPTDAEIAREGFFGTQAATVDASAALAPPPVPVAPVPAAPVARGGLWGFLRPPVAPAVAPPAQEVTPERTDQVALVQPAVPETTADVAVAAAPAPDQPAPPRRRGLLGIFGSNVLELEPELPSETRLGASEQVEPIATDTPQSSPENPVRLAALAPEPQAPAPKRRGLFARLAQPGSAAASDMPEVAYGTVLPFGTIARNCAAKRQSLGRKVESADASGYKLYDSNPRTTAQRTFYITGFDDGCPRQLTAAHVLLGAPSFYELLHYGPAGKHLKFGETDRAYEHVKGRVCGVRKGKPCGAKMNRLERNTFFVNTYPRGDDNRSWSEMLIHEGRVMASTTKSSG